MPKPFLAQFLPMFGRGRCLVLDVNMIDKIITNKASTITSEYATLTLNSKLKQSNVTINKNGSVSNKTFENNPEIYKRLKE